MHLRSVFRVGAVLLAACGGDADDAGVTVDAAAPDAALPCAASDPFRSSTPLVLQHAGQRVVPSGLSADELTAYYSVYRSPGGPTQPPESDIYAAHRADVTQPFDDGAPVEATRTPYLEFNAFESTDGRELFFAREDDWGGSIRLYRALRASRAEPFGVPAAMPLDRLAIAGTVDAAGDELFYAHLSSYVSRTPSIFHATRTSGPFAGGTVFMQFPASEEPGRPVLSGDGLTLYFSRVVDGAEAIWMMHRPLVGGPWSGPDRLPGGDLATPLWESPDGCRLYVDKGHGTYVLSRR